LISFAIAIVLALSLITPSNTLNTENALSIIVAVILGSALTMVLGDIVPEAIGSVYAWSIARVALSPIRVLLLVMSPFTALLLVISRAISSMFGSSQLINTVTEEEIMTLVNAGHSGGTIDEEEKDMIYSVLQLHETTAREVMIPRMDVIALDVETPVKEALNTFVETGFSRVPIYEDNIDNVVGLLYAKDILSLLNNGGFQNKSIRDLIRPSYFVPETKRADALLKELQNRNVHLAIVVDEYGGTSGLVTIENLIEEIVGDIRDEYDVNEEEEYEEAGEGEYVIDASMDLDDLNDLMDCDIETEDADTLGGYIFLMLGRVPELNEVIETDKLSMIVLSIDGRRIRKVKVVKKQEDSTESDTASEPEKMKDETQ
jgi:putative hemolysin